MNNELERLDEYNATVTRLFPSFPGGLVEGWTIRHADAILLARFLECYPRDPIFVLEVGTFVGTSAFHFACQPKVSEVVSIDTNISLSKLADQVASRQDIEDIRQEIEDFRLDASPNVGVLDVAEAVLACFPEQWQKVRLVTGTTRSVDIPTPANGASLVAFVDGSHGKQSVEADLRAIFEQNPYAVAVLDDCIINARTGPAVLTGVAAFIEASSIEYRFRLFKQSDTPSMSSNLSIVYPETVADQLEQSARGLLECPTSALFRASYVQRRASTMRQNRASRKDGLEARLKKSEARLDKLEAKIDRLKLRLQRLQQRRLRNGLRARLGLRLLARWHRFFGKLTN